MSTGEFDVTAVFRDEWPRLVAHLVRDVGDVGLAEDAAQEAFVEAARRWSPGNTPDVPAAWLLTTARRKAIDQLRRSKRLSERLADLAAEAHLTGQGDIGDGRGSSPGIDGNGGRDDLVDDQLALLLGCCHPALSFEAQVALTLRIVAGLSSAQIARAFFVTESTMTRRLTRSKTKIRAANIAFHRSNLETLHERLPVVCAIVYSIFTEGHASAAAPTLLRGDLCDEAIWLGSLLRQLVPHDAEVAGLLALMTLTDARRATRVDHDGQPIRLRDQDRSAWDRAQIDHGLQTLGAAYAMRDAGQYQFQAAIAAIHATARTFAETDWSAIIGLYDVQLRRQPSPILALNRAIALAERDGAAAGLEALDDIRERIPFSGELDNYPYFHTSSAEMLATLGRYSESVAPFERALAVCTNDAERAHLALRIDQVRCSDVDVARRRPDHA